MPERPLVVQFEDLAGAAATWLGQRCAVHRIAPDRPPPAEVMQRAEALIVRTYTTVDAHLLESAPRLRVVGRAGVGLDNIDIAACHARNVEVVYTPDANTQAVVEYVISLLCDAYRPRVELAAPVDEAGWTRLRRGVVGERQLNELTLGVLGLGRIGSRVAAVAGAIGMRVRYHDLVEIPPAQRGGAERIDVDELFAIADVLSVHVDGRVENRGFVSGRLLDRLRPDATLVNTSRGFVVDNLSLARWLQAHPHGRALLDVHDPEPPPPDHPLWNLPNAALYPHLASRTRTAMENMSWVVRDVWAVLNGDTPRWPAMRTP